MVAGAGPSWQDRDYCRLVVLQRSGQGNRTRMTDGWRRRAVKCMYVGTRMAAYGEERPGGGFARGGREEYYVAAKGQRPGANRWYNGCTTCAAGARKVPRGGTNVLLRDLCVSVFQRYTFW